MAALVQALANGRTLADHATAAGVTPNAAKTLLSRAFARTGTLRQSDPVAPALSDPRLRGPARVS